MPAFRRFFNPVLLCAPALLCAAMRTNAQSYTSYKTGDTADVQTTVQPGICLMGGATESDPAMRWLLERAGGGDVVVLRASGADGYNDYFYSELGVAVNSVETILFNDASAAADPYVLNQIAHAEAIWIAGGDQWDYVSYWKGTGVDSLLNAHANGKGAPIGGTSAGMAILGWNYFSAQNGSATSAAALTDPFNADITLGQDDFLRLPFMRNVITDTHYDNPDRRPRHFVFMARLMGGSGDTVRGIACEEYTAVCVDGAGMARVFGDYPAEVDQAYFLQAYCQLPNQPETLAAGQPITWNRGGMAVKAYRVFGDTSGTNTFNLADWKTGSGGFWEDWSAAGGSFNMAIGAQAPDCATGVANHDPAQPGTQPVWLSATRDVLHIRAQSGGELRLMDATGRVLLQASLHAGAQELPCGYLPAGTYIAEVRGKDGTRAVSKL